MNQKKLYFWTFTFREVLPDWHYPYRWQKFIRELVHGIYGGNVAGLRVIEPHQEHGLHYHALLNKRIWVRIVRRIAYKYGIGRVQVSKGPVDIDTADYLGKYLDKKRFGTLTRIARWHSVGNFKAIHKNNIEVISPFNAVVREHLEAKKGRLSQAQYQQLYLEHNDLCPLSESTIQATYGDSWTKPQFSPAHSRHNSLAYPKRASTRSVDADSHPF